MPPVVSYGRRTLCHSKGSRLWEVDEEGGSPHLAAKQALEQWEDGVQDFQVLNKQTEGEAHPQYS